MPQHNAPKSGMVSCLGPKRGEHYFRSADRVNVRVCNPCKRLLAKIGYTATTETRTTCDN